MTRMSAAQASAVLSPDGVYRYLLTRTWEPHRCRLVFIMLNPSTADAQQDDATIRICMGRARRMGAGGIAVVNLFAYRATQPLRLYGATDPIGPENDLYILQAVREDPLMVIAAWGQHGPLRNRAQSVRQLLASVPLHHLGLTKEGQPKHPLRISYDVQPELWA